MLNSYYVMFNFLDLHDGLDKFAELLWGEIIEGEAFFL